MFAVLAAVLVGSANPTAGVLAQGTPPPVEVTGVEYAFQGLPESVPVGTSFRFVNGGQEDHEFFVAKANEGTTETLVELLALPPDQLNGKVTNEGGLFANTGQTSAVTLTFDQPGRYFAVCFITQGTKGGVAPSPGPDGQAGTPHALLGMVAEFTVGAPGASPS
jgi:plastocyanin